MQCNCDVDGIKTRPMISLAFLICASFRQRYIVRFHHLTIALDTSHLEDPKMSLAVEAVGVMQLLITSFQSEADQQSFDLRDVPPSPNKTNRFYS